MDRYDQLACKSNDGKERISKDIFKTLEDLIELKSHIETQLSDLEGWVNEQSIDLYTASSGTAHQ